MSGDATQRLRENLIAATPMGRFGPPPSVIEALSAARGGRTGYTSTEGMPALREALTAKLEAPTTTAPNPDLVSQHQQLHVLGRRGPAE